MEMWVSRYALSGGVKKMEGETFTWNRATKCFHTGQLYLVVGRDCHPTEAEARAAAESMRVKKIASLQKQIARLEKLTF